MNLRTVMTSKLTSDGIKKYPMVVSQSLSSLPADVSSELRSASSTAGNSVQSVHRGGLKVLVPYSQRNSNTFSSIDSLHARSRGNSRMKPGEPRYHQHRHSSTQSVASSSTSLYDDQFNHPSQFFASLSDVSASQIIPYDNGSNQSANTQLLQNRASRRTPAAGAIIDFPRELADLDDDKDNYDKRDEEAEEQERKMARAGDDFSTSSPVSQSDSLSALQLQYIKHLQPKSPPRDIVMDKSGAEYFNNEFSTSTDYSLRKNANSISLSEDFSLPKVKSNKRNQGSTNSMKMAGSMLIGNSSPKNQMSPKSHNAQLRKQIRLQNSNQEMVDGIVYKSSSVQNLLRTESSKQRRDRQPDACMPSLVIDPSSNRSNFMEQQRVLSRGKDQSYSGSISYRYKLDTGPEEEDASFSLSTKTLRDMQKQLLPGQNDR